MKRPMAATATKAVSLGILMILGPTLSWAQAPEPRLGGQAPSGLKRGDSATVSLRGSNLEDAQKLWFDHPGITAEKDDKDPAAFRVTVANDVPPGWYDLRVLTKNGLSNASAFLVGDLPESSETEPNNQPEQASEAAINSVINGELSPAADVDYFAFDGKAGQRVFLDLYAFRIHSLVDGRLDLYAPDGKPLAESQDVYGLDPMLDVTLAADGRYTVRVQDLTYAGSSSGHTYRLMIHDGPRLDAVLPTTARPGELTTFTLFGRNLGGTPAPGLLVNGQECERKLITLRVPWERNPNEPATRFGPLFSWMASRQGFSLGLEEPSASRALFVAQATEPVVNEAEAPADSDQARPQLIVPPCEISGMLDRQNDQDIYQFQARKDQVWRIQAMAERLGSPADLSFVVQRLNDEGQPSNDLATGADIGEPANNFPASLASTDAALTWKTPEDGLYQVVLTDLYGTQRGDARFTYRLRLSEPRPSFELYLMPEDPGGSGLSLPQRGRTTLLAVVNRVEGFDAPIRISPIDVPNGLNINESLIAPDQFQAPVVITVDANIAPGTIFTPTIQGQPLTADGQEALGSMSTQAAIALEPVRGEPANTRGGLRLVKAVHFLPLAVVEPVAFSLVVEPTRAEVKAGESVDLKVKLTRATDFTAEVQVQLTDLPSNLPAATLKVEKDATEAKLNLAVPDNVKPGAYTLLARGSAQIEVATDPEGKKKKMLTIKQPSNPFRLTVLPK